jgi:hypothetical protein
VSGLSDRSLWWRVADYWPFARPRDLDQAFGGWGPQVPIFILVITILFGSTCAYLGGLRVTDLRTVEVAQIAREAFPDIDRFTDGQLRQRMRAHRGAIRLLQDLTAVSLTTAQTEPTAEFARLPIERFDIGRAQIVVDLARATENFTRDVQMRFASNFLLAASIFGQEDSFAQLQAISGLHQDERAALFGFGSEALRRLTKAVGKLALSERNLTRIEEQLREDQAAADRRLNELHAARADLDAKAIQYANEISCIRETVQFFGACLTRSKRPPLRNLRPNGSSR